MFSLSEGVFASYVPPVLLVCGILVVDFLDKAGRSERMSRIRSKDTKPELVLRRSLHKLGLRYKLGGSGLLGKPDLVFPKFKTAVFVHGCFWHRHANCKVASNPKSNSEFWCEKFAKNVARDAKVASELNAAGWNVVVVWECELNTKSSLSLTVQRVASNVRGVTP